MTWPQLMYAPTYATNVRLGSKWVGILAYNTAVLIKTVNNCIIHSTWAQLMYAPASITNVRLGWKWLAYNTAVLIKTVKSFIVQAPGCWVDFKGINFNFFLNSLQQFLLSLSLSLSLSVSLSLSPVTTSEREIMAPRHSDERQSAWRRSQWNCFESLNIIHSNTIPYQPQYSWKRLIIMRHTKHNDTEPYNTQHYDIQHNDTEH